MSRGVRLVLVLLTCVSSPACSHGSGDDDPDGGDREDGGSPDAGDPGRLCEDGDGDGWGEGPDCAGPDCDDADANVHEGCAGCENGSTDPCYDGPPATQGVGACRPGQRHCAEGVWGACDGATLPGDETCDGTDEDCDGEVDDGVMSTCGDCDPGCHLACVGAECAQAFEVGEGAALDEQGRVGPGADATDISRHVMWIPGGSDGVVYKVDTHALKVVGAYALDAPDARRWRTVADTWGNGFVSFDGDGAQRLARIDTECFDTNGDGVVVTSAGQHDLLALGRDDCVRWRSSIDVGYTGALALGPDGRLWVALANQSVVPIDVESGEKAGDGVDLEWVAEALLSTLDGLWIGVAQSVCHVDTETLEMACERMAIRQFLELDVAADGALLSNLPLSRRDPDSGEFTTLLRDVDDFVVDGHGNLWAQPSAGAGFSEVYRYEDPLGDFEVFDLGLASNHITADADGRVWSVATSPGIAAAFDGQSGERRATLFDDCGREGCLDVEAFDGDPAGARLRRAFPDLYERAEAGAVVEATCEPGEHRSWTGLSWEASADAPLVLDVRSAPALDAMTIAPWSLHVRTPPAAGSIPLALDVASEHAFVEIRTRFRSQSARLDRVELRWRCDP